jgi:NADPH2:quinone reductase
MKAIRVHAPGAPDVMKLEEVPDPQPGAGQVVVSIKAAGVNPVDTYIRAGAYGQVACPFTPGMDGAGVVESVGEGVERVRPGDRVFVAGSISGTYAELALCSEKRVHPLPENLSFAQGAALGVPYSTAYTALFDRAWAALGQTVLVHGASGGVGVAAVQLARQAGLTVIGTAGSERGRQLVLEQGAHHVVDHSRPGYEEEIMRLTGGRGVDIILEMLANVNLARDLKLLARKGRVVVIGSRGEVTIDPRDTMRQDSSVIGLLVLSYTEDELADVFRRMAPGLASGALTPVVGAVMPLAEAPKAHEQVMAPGAYGKIVLEP